MNTYLKSIALLMKAFIFISLLFISQVASFPIMPQSLALLHYFRFGAHTYRVWQNIASGISFAMIYSTDWPKGILCSSHTFLLIRTDSWCFPHYHHVVGRLSNPVHWSFKSVHHNEFFGDGINSMNPNIFLQPNFWCNFCSNLQRSLSSSRAQMGETLLASAFYTSFPTSIPEDTLPPNCIEFPSSHVMSMG